MPGMDALSCAGQGNPSNREPAPTGTDCDRKQSDQGVDPDSACRICVNSCHRPASPSRDGPPSQPHSYEIRKKDQHHQGCPAHHTWT